MELLLGNQGGGIGRASSIQTGTKLHISNLDYGVSNDDLKKHFSEVGDLKRSAVNHDENGRSMGTAEVVYSRREDAVAAVKRYNNVQLDGMPMKIEIVGLAAVGALPRPPVFDSFISNPLVRSFMLCPTHSDEELQLIEHKKTYHCDGCDMKGKGQGYRCCKCDYVLHTNCMNPKPLIVPSFFVDDGFIFLEKPIPAEKPKEKRFCGACGFVISGFNYHGDKAGFDLHPCCASLKSHLDVNGQKLTLKKSAHKKCVLCDSKGVNKSNNRIDPGWFYASEGQDYKYHVYCIMKMANESSLAELENLPVVKTSKGGGAGSKFWRMLKAVVTYVIAIVFGDPTTIALKLFVDGVLYLGDIS